MTTTNFSYNEHLYLLSLVQALTIVWPADCTIIAWIRPYLPPFPWRRAYEHVREEAPDISTGAEYARTFHQDFLSSYVSSVPDCQQRERLKTSCSCNINSPQLEIQR